MQTNRSNSPLHLAVVGHTNTGKTSLLRTLTRSTDFGEVQDRPGTTRHVEGARLLVDGATAIELFDTPGMEDSIALADYLDQLVQRADRLDGPESIRRFLDSPESGRRFEQEARVLRKLLECDAGLYVIDVRDPVLGKHKDELAILSRCGRPLLPILNFTYDAHQNVELWRNALARLGLHAIVEFDTVAPALDGEVQLYDKLALLLDAHGSTLKALKDDIAEQREIRLADAFRLIAELLIDTAALRLASQVDEASVKQATEKLRSDIRRRENDCIKALLKRYNFKRQDFPGSTLALQGERWGMDLFHPQALKDMGIHITKGMAAGAMAGATVDLFTAGLSLGSAALIGAAAGGLWQSADRVGKRIVGRLKGYREISVTDGVLRLLAIRAIALIQALERRGHAAQDAISLAPYLLEDATSKDGISGDAGITVKTEAETGTGTRSATEIRTEPSWGPAIDALRNKKLPPELHEARSQPQWSMLSDSYSMNPRREQAIRSLAGWLANQQHSR